MLTLFAGSTTAGWNKKEIDLKNVLVQIDQQKTKYSVLFVQEQLKTLERLLILELVKKTHFLQSIEDTMNLFEKVFEKAIVYSTLSTVIDRKVEPLDLYFHNLNTKFFVFFNAQTEVFSFPDLFKQETEQHLDEYKHEFAQYLKNRQQFYEIAAYRSLKNKRVHNATY